MNASTLETNNAHAGMTIPAAGTTLGRITAEILSLQHDLQSLDSQEDVRRRQFTAVHSIYARCRSIVASCIPSLISSSATTPTSVRQSARSLQLLLESLSDALLRLLGKTLTGIENDNERANFRQRVLLGILDTTAQHILISALTSSHTAKGMWLRLHQIYLSIRNEASPQSHPAGQELSPDEVYFSAVLLGYAVSASFSPAEIAFLDACFRHHSNVVEISRQEPEPATSCLWIAPESDMPATSHSRRHPPPDTPILYFSGSRLADEIRRQLAQLEAGTPAREMKLPDFANTPAGKNVLRRTADLLDTHLKRRFPRRRQNYRGEMYFGIESICHIHARQPKHAPPSHWMITNESPDGYAAMLISGRAASVSAGDVAALRIGGAENWQLCIIRWIHSVNPEHLELGLQMLATHVIPASVATPNSSNKQSFQQAALLLPSLPSVQEHEAIVLPSGTPAGTGSTFILVTEQNIVSVREIRLGQRDEQTARIELFRIDTV